MASAQQSESGTTWSRAGTAVLAIVVYGMAVLGMCLGLGTYPTLDILYRGLQLFVLDDQALDPPTQVNTLLQLARFLAPFTTLLALVLTLRRLLAEQLHRRRIAAMKGHAIVSGDDETALALARNLTEVGRAVVGVGAAFGTPGAAQLPAVPGDPRDAATLRAAGLVGASAVYACADHSTDNAAVALAAIAERAGVPSRLRVFAQVRSDSLVEALRLQRISTGDPAHAKLEFFNVDDIAARALLARYPVESGSPVVCGFGRTGRAVLRAIVRGPGGAGPRPVIVSGARPDAVERDANRLDAEARGWVVRAGTARDGDGIVYVCLDDEEDALATGLRLGAARERTVVVCLRRQSPFRETLAGSDGVHIFGILDEACQPSAIESDSIVDRAARAIHEGYLAEAEQRGESRQTNKSLVPWQELPQHLKESNYAQAEHMGRKLQEIGAVLVGDRPREPFEFTAEELQRLARLEHARWMEERLAAGFVHGPRREGRFHPDLVDWPELSEESRQKDVDAVLHLPDVLAADGIYIARR